jgi:hypothetical protein
MRCPVMPGLLGRGPGAWCPVPANATSVSGRCVHPAALGVFKLGADLGRQGRVRATDLSDLQSDTDIRTGCHLPSLKEEEIGG